MHYIASKVQFAQLFLKNPSKGINTSLDAHPFPPMLVQTHNKHRDLTNMGKNKTNSTSQSNKQDWEGNSGVAMQIPQKAAEEEEGQGHGYITKHINDTKRLLKETGGQIWAKQELLRVHSLSMLNVIIQIRNRTF